MNLKIDRTTKLRWRRSIKQRKRLVEELGTQAEEQLENNIIKRVPHLWQVRRFLFSWLLLLLLLLGGTIAQINGLGRAYQRVAPAPGGIYTEGILGQFTNASPMYATSAVDTSVSRLVFAGLFKFDESHRLVGDLAQGFSSNEKGDEYTVTLRPDLHWHDGHPVTSKDVVFTYRTLQNPDAKSPLQSSWRGIEVTAIDARTVRFKLPNTLSSFPFSMINGLVPEHVLKDVPAAELRSANFNTARPVGTGPFQWETIQVSGDSAETREERIALVPYKRYHSGKPKIDRFVIRAIHDQRKLRDSLKSQEITAAAGLQDIGKELRKQTNIHEHNIPFSGEVMVFFKNSQPPFDDPAVRKALVLASDRVEIIRQLGYPAKPAEGPLLKGMVGYDPQYRQVTGNKAEAIKVLDAAGWKPGKDGIRQKGDQPLSFQFFAENTAEYVNVTSLLRDQWKAVGADAKLQLQPQSDLQSSVAFHLYDALLFGVSLGTDPDVYAYWHSSQGDIRSANRLNLSEYRSGIADKALEAGRTRGDTSLRAIKYKPFLQAWRDDNPALALYQPRFLYASSTKVYNFDPLTLSASNDRYANVHNWMIRETEGLK